MINNQRVVLGLDVSTQTIGVTILLDDGSDYGKIIELTHINPKVSSKKKDMEKLFLKKRIFEEFISKYKDFGIDEVVIEEPLISSNNSQVCATLLRFNGMISDCIYNVLGIVPEYISSYEARKYSFPELMAIRKYNREGQQYDFEKIKKEIIKEKFVLFGSYSWEVDKKIIIQDKVSGIFPDIQWIYDKNGELKKENFDASDSYVCILAKINKEKYGELTFKVKNIKIKKCRGANKGQMSIDYDVEYWDKKVHRTTYAMITPHEAKLSGNTTTENAVMNIEQNKSEEV